MDKSSCLYIGRVIKTHGIKGILVISIENYRIDLFGVEFLFADLNGTLVPFFIEEATYKDTKSYFVNFENINNPEEAKLLTGCDLYIPLDRLPEIVQDDNSITNVIQGFKVTDISYGDIGILEDIMDIPGNPLLKVISGTKEVLIPLTDEYIKEINHDLKLITLDCPEGLISLFLDE